MYLIPYQFPQTNTERKSDAFFSAQGEMEIFLLSRPFSRHSLIRANFLDFYNHILDIYYS